MLRAKVTRGSYTANTNIPLTLNLSTNSKAVLSNDTILLKTTGIKDIKANVVFTPTTAGTVTLSLLANGTAISGAVYTTTVTTDSTATFIINDAIKIINNTSGSIANISIQLNAAGTLVDGAVIVENLS